jgi:outer membrane receptor protein involved in Fe transport
MAPHTHSMFTLARVFVFLLALLPLTATAQVPTGTVSGRVTDSQDRSIGTVVVTVNSPALQGTQTTTTTANGDYVFRFLPPGVYTITFEGAGFAAERRTVTVAATESINLNATLEPATVTESVTVVADGNTFTNTVQVATSVTQDLLDALPTGRTLRSAVNLAPAVHQTGPGGEVSIAGAMSFENLYLVNGVQIQDNIRGEPLDLFIEDAIQETTIATGGISAEYGRFTGGVVNAVTKSGGNIFSGSFRTSFRNDNWRTISPFEESKISQVVPTYEYTFGGPVLQDKTWFFTAGRFENAETSRETSFTEIPYVLTTKERRFEIKGTQALATGQRLQVGYTTIREEQANSSQGAIMDLASLTNPRYPQTLFAAHYTASLRNNLFVEAQYSARQFTFENSGGSSRDRILGTTLSDNQTGAYYFSPLYCAVCGNEERDNSSIVLKASYLVSTANAGSHNVVVGYDTFNDRITGDNQQSGSDFHIWTTATTIDNGTVYPVIEPGFSTYIINWPILEASKGSNFRSHAVFAHDTWDVNRYLRLDLGVRFDKNAGRDASENLVADDSAFSPRLGLVWDPAGNGRTSINASFGRYVAGINNSVAGSASPAGSPAILAYFYDGPAINAGGGPLVSSADAIRQVFNWFDAAQPGPFQATIPGVGLRVGDSVKSPYSDDTVFGISHQLTSRASVRLDFVNRSFGNFYSGRIDTTTGQASDEFGQVVDVEILENTNDLTRKYQALNGQISFRASRDLNAGATYTLSRLKGNINGETIDSGPIASSLSSYPEFSDPAWSNPEGDLDADQRHRARIWATYSLPWGRDLVNATFGFLQTLESGSPYGAVGDVPVDPFVDNPGYAITPGLASYFFTARDAFRTETQKRSDLSLRLSRRVGGTSAPEVFADFELLNAFNQFQLFNISNNGINTTVVTAVDDPNLEFFNPFTETPVEGVHWRKGRRFGQATERGAYTLPRTFRFSVGIRF